MENQKDNVIPTSKWSFSDDVTKCFGDMLSRSIPSYDTMRSLTYMLGFSFVTQGKDIIDIGCSTGLGVDAFIKHFGCCNRYILIDESESMSNSCKEKYKSWIESGIVRVDHSNICQDGIPHSKACLILSILTLQFTPIEYRQHLLKQIYERLDAGGAFIFVEKILGSSAETNALLVDNYYAIKEKNGYTKEMIDAKRKSLERVLVPVTYEANESFLKNAGFSRVECFWRCLNFCGWIAVK